jgi:hypothetical protein
MDSKTQLEYLFGNIPDGFRFLVCTKRDFSGQWFGDAISAAEFAAAESASTDVYVGVGIRHADRLPPPKSRGSADSVEGIVGLWLDVDVADVGHEKTRKRLPGSIEEARRLLFGVLPSMPPSIVVFSGHGLQGWWLFPEPWIFESAEDRKKAAAFAHRFTATARAVARLNGWSVDGTFDLARVMRLAGTWNRKTDPPVATRLEIPSDGRVLRYFTDDLEGCFVADEVVEETAGRGIPVDPLILGVERKPPFDAFTALMQNHEKARLSWEKKRTDLADQSGSSYDFSLAVIALSHGWKDQEVADLLVARRVKHGEDQKTTRGGFLRQDYYQRTILAAKKVVANERDSKAYDSPDEPPLVADGKPIAEESRPKIFEKARGVFGLPIVRFVQHGEASDARYSFVLADGTSIELGAAVDLEDQRRVRATIYAAIRRYPKSLKAPAWARMFEELGAVCEVVDNPESGRIGRFAALLYEYLSDKTGAVSSALRNEASWQGAVPTGDPFVRDGRLYVCVPNIEQYVRAVYARKTDVRELWSVLMEWGFANESVSVRVGQRKVARRYWSAPVDDLAERRGFVLPLVYGGQGGANHGGGTSVGGVPPASILGDRGGGKGDPGVAFPGDWVGGTPV